MCKWQNGAVEKLSAVVEEFKEMSVSMSQLNSDLVNEEKIRRESEDRMLEVCKEAKYYVDSFREYRDNTCHRKRWQDHDHRTDVGKLLLPGNNSTGRICPF